MAAPTTWRTTGVAVGALVALRALTSAVPAGAGMDPTGPQIAIFKPSDGNGSGLYVQGQQVAANYLCYPGSLGTPVVSCTGDVPVGQDFDTSATLAGGGFGGSGWINGSWHTFTVHAVDAAGAEAADPGPVAEGRRHLSLRRHDDAVV